MMLPRDSELPLIDHPGPLGKQQDRHWFVGKDLVRDWQADTHNNWCAVGDKKGRHVSVDERANENSSTVPARFAGTMNILWGLSCGPSEYQCHENERLYRIRGLHHQLGMTVSRKDWGRALDDGRELENAADWHRACSNHLHVDVNPRPRSCASPRRVAHFDQQPLPRSFGSSESYVLADFALAPAQIGMKRR